MNRPVTKLPQRPRRERRALPRRAARHERAGGRAWINGREVGAPDARFAHLSASYD